MATLSLVVLPTSRSGRVSLFKRPEVMEAGTGPTETVWGKQNPVGHPYATVSVPLGGGSTEVSPSLTTATSTLRSPSQSPTVTATGCSMTGRVPRAVGDYQILQAIAVQISHRDAAGSGADGEVAPGGEIELRKGHGGRGNEAGSGK